MIRAATSTFSLLTTYLYATTTSHHHAAAAFQRFLVPAFSTIVSSRTPASSSSSPLAIEFKTPARQSFSSSASLVSIASAESSTQLSNTNESISIMEKAKSNNKENQKPAQQENSIVQRLADRQAEWQALSLGAKADLLQKILQRLSQLSAEEYVARLGTEDAKMMGFDADSAGVAKNEEANYEATQVAFVYVAMVLGVVQKLHHAYQVAAGRQAPATFPIDTTRRNNTSATTTVQTHPVSRADKMSPVASFQTHVWLKQSPDNSNKNGPFGYQVQATLDQNKKDGCMIVLGAGNHCFLSAVDCLHGLFVENSVVLLKHHPLRGKHHDDILRDILQPVLDLGYFDTLLDTGDVADTQSLVYHPATSKVHLTGGKATHDAIVWGDAKDRTNQKLKATMTSELGCVTPWIVAPTATPWTDAQLDHQVKHLHGSLYSNAGANCNSPKVIVLGRDWPQSAQFVEKLKEQLASQPPPVAYYPGARERWNKFRQVYPTALELGDPTTKEHRPLLPNATVLPWLVIDNVSVDLSTPEGRTQAQTEYAFHNEPFAPVVTIAYVDTLSTAVELANNYLFGSLSCTLIAPQLAGSDDAIEQAIADLQYGGIAVNCWSGLCYFPMLSSTWGAYPGESLDQVESGIGCIHNYYFLPNIEKSVVRSPMISAVHIPPYPHGKLEAKRNESLATAKFLLRPGPLTLVNLILTALLGVQPAGLFQKIRQKMAARLTFLWRRGEPSATKQQ